MIKRSATIPVTRTTSRLLESMTFTGRKGLDSSATDHTPNAAPIRHQTLAIRLFIATSMKGTRVTQTISSANRLVRKGLARSPTGSS